MLSVPEEKFLRTIELEEKFGGKTYQQQKAKDDKKKAEKGKAAIGFVYDDSTQVQDETEAQGTWRIPFQNRERHNSFDCR